MALRLHGLDWQDQYSALLDRCGKVRIADGPVLHVDGDILPDEYAEQVCPVCGVQLKLIWDVRAEVR